jgi:hypothetical protein
MEFTMHGNESLKEKRNVAHSLKRKMRNKFNVSVAEVESQGSHSRLVLAAVCVSATRSHAESRMTKLHSMVEAISPEEMTDSFMEFLHPE